MFWDIVFGTAAAIIVHVIFSYIDDEVAKSRGIYRATGDNSMLVINRWMVFFASLAAGSWVRTSILTDVGNASREHAV